MSFGFSTFNQIPFATQLAVEAGVALVGSVTASGSVQGVTVTGAADFVTGAIFASGVVNAVDSVTGGASFTTDSISGTGEVGSLTVIGGALFTTGSVFGTGVINPVTATGGTEITVGSITAEGVVHPLDSVTGGADFTIVAPNAGIMPDPVYTFQVNTFGLGEITDTQYRFGSGSLSRCAIGNYQSFLSTSHTVEFFFKPMSWGPTISTQTLADLGRFVLRMTRVGTTKKFVVWDNVQNTEVVEWVPTNPDDLLLEWNHIVLWVNSWSGTFWQDLTLMSNGVFRDYIRIFPSFTNPPLAEEEFLLGGNRSASGDLINDYGGFIDEFRVSSVIRYSGSIYTVPTSALTDDDDTVVLYHFDEADGYRGILTNSSGNTPVGTHKVLAGAAAATTGINADGVVGAVSEVTGGANFTVTGVLGTGAVTNVNVYGIVFSDQNPSYTVVSPDQTPAYTTISPTEDSNLSNIAPNQNPNYSEISPSQSPNYDEEV